VRVTDGALKGIDYAKRLREWRTRLRDIRSLAGTPNERQADAANEKTDFSELSATFQIANGVATSKDLAMKAPLVRLSGAGAIDIGNDRVDYTVEASLVNTLTGQGGKERTQAGVEVTVPVRVVGPLAQPQYEVLWAKAAGGALKGALDVLTKPPQPGENPDPAKALRDRFKGLFK
ncbi:MAG TPA: AsmA-like C-terminal region-containing protein, partial [Burkholderiaceae bacterium]|nr:AsmA-like C-terminal region-containing protein [Burkholderiaceae bacterium]